MIASVTHTVEYVSMKNEDNDDNEEEENVSPQETTVLMTHEDLETMLAYIQKAKDDILTLLPYIESIIGILIHLNETAQCVKIE